MFTWPSSATENFTVPLHACLNKPTSRPKWMGSKSQEKVFLREATGLRKNVSFLDALSMNVGVMSAGPTLAVIGFTMILLPSVAGINLVWGSLISAILV